MRIHRHTFLGRGEHEQIHVSRDGDNFKLSTVNTNDFEQIEIVLNRRRVIELRDRFNEIISIVDAAPSTAGATPTQDIYNRLLDNYERHQVGIDVSSSAPLAGQYVPTSRPPATSYYNAGTPVSIASGSVDNWVEMPAGTNARIVPRSYSGVVASTPSPEELDF